MLAAIGGWCIPNNSLWAAKYRDSDSIISFSFTGWRKFMQLHVPSAGFGYPEVTVVPTGEGPFLLITQFLRCNVHPLCHSQEVTI
jgi:hypothetical protein